MRGNARLRSTLPVLHAHIAALTPVISALVMQQQLVALDFRQVGQRRGVEIEEMFEKQEAFRTLQAQHRIIENALQGLRFAHVTIIEQDESLLSPFPDEVDYLTEFGFRS
eukprot:7014580-Pyramimonas_sp.AAC.1